MKTNNETLALDALKKMCFCKQHICKRCGNVNKLIKRCENEIIRDNLFKKLAKQERLLHPTINKNTICSCQTSTHSVPLKGSSCHICGRELL